MLQSVIYRKSRKISNTGQEQYNNILRLRRQPSNDVCEVSSEPPGVGYRYRYIGIGHLYGKPITPMIGGTATQRHNCIGSVLLCSFKICVQLPPNNCTTEQLHSFPADLFLRPSISQLHLGTCSSFSLEKRFRTEKWLTLLVQLYSKYKTIQMSFS